MERTLLLTGGCQLTSVDKGDQRAGTAAGSLRRDPGTGTEVSGRKFEEQPESGLVEEDLPQLVMKRAKSVPLEEGPAGATFPRWPRLAVPLTRQAAAWPAIPKAWHIISLVSLWQVHKHTYTGTGASASRGRPAGHVTSACQASRSSGQARVDGGA